MKVLLKLATKFPNNSFLIYIVEKRLYEYYKLFIEVQIDYGGTYYYAVVKVTREYLGGYLAVNDWPCGQFFSVNEAKIDSFKKKY